MPLKRRQQKARRTASRTQEAVGRVEKGKRLVSGGLTDAVRKVLVDAGNFLRAADIVDKFPGFGYKVKDVAAVRKRVSIVLAAQKKNFEWVGRGLYKIVE